jgi:hypothetical protein
MKQKKLRLADLQGKLTREEMKRIMAGSGGSGEGCTCNSSDDCTDPRYPVCVRSCEGPHGQYHGHCAAQ